MATAFTYKPISWIFLRSEGLTIWTQSKDFRIRGHSVPRDPKTEDQLSSRAYFATAKRLWSTLSDMDKAVWGAFARETVHMNKREQPSKGRGIDAFVRASITRQTAGLDAMPGLPRGLFLPQRPAALDLLPGADARELVFRIEHKNDDVSSHAMLVRMTPTGKSVACRPYKSSLRHVRGICRDSVIPLPASGETVRIDGTRFELEPGCIYAVEVRIVRLADGAVSEPYYNAAVREEVAADELSAEAPQQIPAEMQPSGQTKAERDGEGEGEGDQMGKGMEEGTEVQKPDEPFAPDATLSPATPTVADSAAAQETSALTQIADRRGSIHFPSAYVLNEYFRPQTRKNKRNVVGTNIGGAHVSSTAAAPGSQSCVIDPRSPTFGTVA